MTRRRTLRRIGLAALLLTGCAHIPVPGGVARDVADTRGQAYRSAPPMDLTVSTRVVPQVEALLDGLLEDGRGYRLDGVEVFAANDRFLPGKLAIALAHVLSATPRDDPKFDRYLRGFGALSVLTLEDPNESWGIYYYASALHELQTLGVLDEAVSADVLARLRERLDWRTFVREDDLTLIDLPNNYYGVAFSIARLRYLLGWEEAAASEALLAKTLDHFREYSGAYGFADETAGEGRFDRYSVLLIGEIAQRFIETGVEPPADVRAWLRQSVDVMLPRFNLRGEGFEYGRSIGPYGETAFLEVLSAAAALDVLTPEEKEMAYAFSSRVAARYADFWLDPGTGSVNLWDGGRATDAYRGKHRILGENLSLGHQLYYTNAIWNRLGYRERRPTEAFEAWLDRLPRSTTTWFARGDNDRLVITYRDGRRVIGLPLINGARGQHQNTPYYPIPFSPGVLAGSADRVYPQLIPQLTLADGSILTPTSYFEDVTVTVDGARTVITLRQTALNRMGQDAPEPDARVQIETRYEFAPGEVSRSDRIMPAAGVVVRSVDMDFATFSSAVEQRGSEFVFDEGEVSGFAASGMTCRSGVPDPEVHRTPVGAHQTLLSCRAPSTSDPFVVAWRMTLLPTD